NFEPSNTGGSSCARAAYKAAVYPAGPEPTMIRLRTCSDATRPSARPLAVTPAGLSLPIHLNTIVGGGVPAPRAARATPTPKPPVRVAGAATGARRSGKA